MRSRAGRTSRPSGRRTSPTSRRWWRRSPRSPTTCRISAAATWSAASPRTGTSTASRSCGGPASPPPGSRRSKAGSSPSAARRSRRRSLPSSRSSRRTTRSGGSWSSSSRPRAARTHSGGMTTAPGTTCGSAARRSKRVTGCSRISWCARVPSSHGTAGRATAPPRPTLT